MKTYLRSIYEGRFDDSLDSRNTMWKILCKNFFQKFVKHNATVLDLAAGYCEFINNIDCKKKIAVDLNPKTRQMADKNVVVYEALSTKMPRSLTSTVDVVFVSNFFEHLDSKDELLETLLEIYRVLKKSGTVMVLQPNIRLVGQRYWDYVDHTLPLTDKSLCEALSLSGFEVILKKARFLPYTANSKMPSAPFLIKLYLKLPVAQFLLGKQTFVIGRK